METRDRIFWLWLIIFTLTNLWSWRTDLPAKVLCGRKTCMKLKIINSPPDFLNSRPSAAIAKTSSGKSDSYLCAPLVIVRQGKKSYLLFTGSTTSFFASSNSFRRHLAFTHVIQKYFQVNLNSECAFDVDGTLGYGS